jgi:hypothetical protein
MSTTKAPQESSVKAVPITAHVPDQTGAAMGKAFGIFSVALFLFLTTFAIAVSTVDMGNRVRGALVIGMMLFLLLGSVAGLVAVIFRGKPVNRTTLAMGISGLCLNAVFLLAMFAIILIGLIGVMIRHPQSPVTTVPQQQPPVVVYRPSSPRPIPAYLPYNRPFNSVPHR